MRAFSPIKAVTLLTAPLHTSWSMTNLLQNYFIEYNEVRPKVKRIDNALKSLDMKAAFKRQADFTGFFEPPRPAEPSEPQLVASALHTVWWMPRTNLGGVESGMRPRKAKPYWCATAGKPAVARKNRSCVLQGQH